MPLALERWNYPSPGMMRHIAALPLTCPATGSPLPLGRARAHRWEVNGTGAGLKISCQIFHCLPASPESQGPSWWLRHGRNRNPCFRGSLERWGTSGTLRASPGTPLLPPPPPPSPRQQGTNRCFPDPRLVCPREGAALALPFPTYPAGKTAGSADVIYVTPRKVSEKPRRWQSIALCLRVKSRKTLRFSSQRAVGSTILCCCTPAYFPDWQQCAQRQTRHKMKTQNAQGGPHWKQGEHPLEDSCCPPRVLSKWCQQINLHAVALAAVSLLHSTYQRD